LWVTSQSEVCILIPLTCTDWGLKLPNGPLKKPRRLGVTVLAHFQINLFHIVIYKSHVNNLQSKQTL